jgi:predicted SnoaL-like aldol condensation-catalyzing enzyme
MVSSTLEQKNKELVARFFQEFFTGPADANINHLALNELVHENYVQHNPLAGQGREGLRNFLVNIYPKMATKALVESKQLRVNLIADGALVVRQEVRTEWMLIDIFRIQGGWLMEHWDAWRSEPGIERPPGF